MQTKETKDTYHDAPGVPCVSWPVLFRSQLVGDWRNSRADLYPDFSPKNNTSAYIVSFREAV